MRVEFHDVTEDRRFVQRRKPTWGVRKQRLLRLLVVLDRSHRREASGLAAKVKATSASEQTDRAHDQQSYKALPTLNRQIVLRPYGLARVRR